jgi:hypothetical protein
MTRRLIAYTEDSSLRQTMPGALSFSYIRALIQKQLGAEAAAMLSEPQIVPRDGRHQWLADIAIDASLTRLDQASAEQAAVARRTLVKVRGRARMIADELNATGSEQNRLQALVILRAFVVPHDDEYVWLVGERPLLVGWGYEKADVVPLESAALAVSYRRPIPKTAARSVAITQSETAPSPPLPEPPLATSFWSWSPVFLWLLFIGLALKIGGLLLPVCSIQIPGTQWRLTSLSGCAPHAHNPLADLLAQNRALEDAMRTQQIAIRARNLCQPMPRPELFASSPNLPTLPPHVDTTAPVQARLDWDTDDDLDLVVKCPAGGWISPLRQHLWAESCGDGQRDLDANYKMAKRDHPTTEHISWRELRPGSYRVVVWPASTGSGNPIRFRVTLTFFGRTQTCSGEVAWDESKGEGYVAYVMDFDAARPLPSCNLSSPAEGYLQVCAKGCGKD